MLNKKTAIKIFSEIKKAKTVLLLVHVAPDTDGIASVLAMNLFLKSLGKKTRIISFGQIPFKFQYLSGVEAIETFDFAKVNFKAYDLFISIDCAQEIKITRSPFPQKFPKNFKIINIDHHVSNTKFGHINLVEAVSSTAELLYQLFGLWQVKIDRKLASLLFIGVFADTGCFQYPLTTPDTFRMGADLIEKGASLNDAVIQNFRLYNFKTLKYWGRVLDNMQVDKSKTFVWSKITEEERLQLEVETTEMEGASNLFAPIVAGTEFGIILTEESGNLTRGSLRSRAGFDVSKIAVDLGGGGHKQAAGFSVNLPPAEAEKKIFEVIYKQLGLKVEEGV